MRRTDGKDFYVMLASKNPRIQNHLTRTMFKIEVVPPEGAFVEKPKGWKQMVHSTEVSGQEKRRPNSFHLSQEKESSARNAYFKNEAAGIKTVVLTNGELEETHDRHEFSAAIVRDCETQTVILFWI